MREGESEYGCDKDDWKKGREEGGGRQALAMQILSEKYEKKAQRRKTTITTTYLQKPISKKFTKIVTV